MKIKLFLTYILLWHLSMAMQAQTFTLHGRVTDENSQPIEFASVACLQQGKMTMTSLKGEFNLQLHSADSVVIRFSMIGYRAKTKVLRKPRGKQLLQIVLHSSDNTLEGVTVTDTRRQTSQTQEIKKEDLKSLPSTSGNAVEELIQSQAGVSTHNELSSQYNVRGGSFDENSVYINNVEIFRPFLVRSGQQEGISVINPDMVEKSDSLPAATKPVMATRCRRLSTLPTSIPRNSRLPCRRVCLGQAHILASATKRCRGVTD